MESIFKILAKEFPDDYISLIHKEYNDFKDSYYSEDKKKVVMHSGRFSELISSLLCMKELGQKDDLNKISFNSNLNNLEQSKKNSNNKEITCLMIPRVLRAIYTIRNKKNIAHIKTFDPIILDLKFVNIAVDWVISQLLLVYCNVNNDTIIKYFEKISLDDYRKVERFEDGDILFKDPKISFTSKLLFILADYYNKGRISKEKLLKISKPKNNSYINTYINLLKKNKHVHINKDGIKLTKWGMNEARKIRKSLNK